MKTTRKFIFALIFCTAFSAAAESPLAVTLRLSADRTLPSIPVDLEFTVTNRTDAALPLPAAYVIEATPAGGEPFLISWYEQPAGTIQNAEEEVWLGETAIGARQSRTIRLASWPYPLVAEGVLPTEQLNTPGAYTLRVAFSTGFYNFVRHDLPRMPGTIGEMGSHADLAVTNSVRLEIVAPAGEDAVVWEKMRKAGGGSPDWPAQFEKRLSIARVIWDQHRSSQYAAYASATLFGESIESHRQIRDELQKHHRQHPYVEWFDAHEASLHLRDAGELVAAGASLAEIMRQVDLAARRVEKTLKTSKNDELILYARQTLERVAEQREFLPLHFESMKNSARRQPLAVTPLVTCGKVSGAETHVVFGYDNPNKHNITIPIGTRNMFVPGDMVRGQVTSFAAGRHEKAFRVKAKGGGPLTWQLDGTSLTVEPGKIRRCSDAEL